MLRVSRILACAALSFVLGVLDHDTQPALDQRQVLTIRSHQRRRRPIVVEIDDDLRFGRSLQVAVKFAAGSE